MGIFRALGLGLVIIILKFLVPRLFAALEAMLLALFRSATSLFDHATLLSTSF